MLMCRHCAVICLVDVLRLGLVIVIGLELELATYE